MNTKKILPYILLVLLALTALVIKQCKQTTPAKAPSAPTVKQVQDKQSRGLNRNPVYINYSKHAKCRMQCRHIDEMEIKDILHNGTINYKKSELQDKDCRKKYAVEGYSKDNQHLRIIFAPCGDELTVVTCIDIEQDWSCDCK